MGNIKVLLLIIVLNGVLYLPSHAQQTGITFRDSVYVATQTHYFIPVKVKNSDTLEITDTTGIEDIEWRSNGKVIEPEATMRSGYLTYQYQFTRTGTFDISMELVDTAGLSYFASKSILVSDQIEIPNVFSPDEDGINDVFIIKSGGSTTLNLKIYTRNGNLIHEKIGQVVYWDGKLASGNYAKPGVYYYVLTSQGSEDIVRKGFFHLFR